MSWKTIEERQERALKREEETKRIFKDAIADLSLAIQLNLLRKQGDDFLDKHQKRRLDKGVAR